MNTAVYALLLLWMLATLYWWPRPALPALRDVEPLRYVEHVGATEHWSAAAEVGAVVGRLAGDDEPDPVDVAALDAVEQRLHDGLHFVEVFVTGWLLDEQRGDPWVAVHLAMDGIEVS